jgi:transcriptional regulator GlxA family with amidase domain
MSRAEEESNRRMLRARDAMDRTYAQPLDVPALARIAHVSEAHFIRTFRATFGETPHRYLQRRRVERSMYLLRETGRSITDICLDVGFSSLGTFSRTFREIVGEPPSVYRTRVAVELGAAALTGPAAVPSCFAMAWTRPSSFGEANEGAMGLD